jgi:signal transduction histidine kinase
MTRLYLRIYLAVLAVLALLALAAGLLWHFLGDAGPAARMRENVAQLVANALPAADAPRAVQQAALEKMLAGVSAEVTIYSAHRERLAVVGAELPLPERGPMHRAMRDGPPPRMVNLPDGRVVVARPLLGVPFHMKKGGPPWVRWGVLPMLAVLALAVGIGAYPVVRRLTRRLERLQAGVEALGAGTLSARVAVEGNDEVARLAESFNRAAQRIEELVAAHKTLLANASHELRTPLARIRMGVELARTQDTVTRRVEIERDIAELDALIDEILLASRLDTGNPALERERFEDVDLLALAAEECARIESAVLNGEPITVRGDARLLRRMIRNLLENARRHGAPPIAVTLIRAQGEARLTVRDHGPGIPAQERERVFEPFYRRAGAADGGAGLGLALVRQIARRHGGDAKVDADGFTVTLAREAV